MNSRTIFVLLVAITLSERETTTAFLNKNIRCLHFPILNKNESLNQLKYTTNGDGNEGFFPMTPSNAQSPSTNADTFSEEFSIPKIEKYKEKTNAKDDVFLKHSNLTKKRQKTSIESDTWYTWLARLRIYKKKMMNNSKISSYRVIKNELGMEFPYAQNSKEATEGYHLSIWVNFQIDQLDLTMKKVNFDEYEMDPRSKQKSNLLLQELKGLYKILPSTMPLSEIIELQNKAQVKQHQVDWEKQFENLVKFKEENGHCRVPRKYVKNQRLSDWVYRQRCLFSPIVSNAKIMNNSSTLVFDFDNEYEMRYNKLAKIRIEKLTEIEFDFELNEIMDLQNNDRANHHQVEWEKQFENLVKFKEENGHCRVPRTYIQNQSLGDWVSRQRWLYSTIVRNAKIINNKLVFDFDSDYEIKNIKLAEKRIEKLIEIGFDFDAQPTRQKRNDRWRTRFYELQEFNDKYGHCVVPYRYPSNQALGYWVNLQRWSYKALKFGADPDLTYARWRALERMGFKWGSENRDDIWNERYKELEGYNAIHGDCDVPYKYPPNPRLGLWVSYQRSLYHRLQAPSLKDGKTLLPPYRIKALDQLNFKWEDNKYSSSIQKQNQQRIVELREFQLIHEHLNVPATYGPNEELSSWVRAIRKEYKAFMSLDSSSCYDKNNAILTHEVMDALTSLGFEF